MKAEEFIEQQIKAGYRIHLHDGVWWQRYAPLFYRPASPLQIIRPGAARPDPRRSLLGYSHIVDDMRSANKFWPVMLLEGEGLANFAMTGLSSSKRARVRKGMKLNEIRKIEAIDTVLNDMKNICVSAAVRTRHGKPPEYYVKKAGEWELFMRSEFAMPHREWWGAFHEGRLVAYYYAYGVEDTMFLSAAKSHSDYLDNCPNDSLLFTFLAYCRDLPDCRRVIFGDWSRDAPSLNKFKELYGFRRADLPVFARYNPVVRLAKKLKK